MAVKRLVPYNAPQVPYYITVAEVYFPKDLVDALQQFILTPGSLIYRNPDLREQTLALLVDPRVKINDPTFGDDLISPDNSDKLLPTGVNGSLDRPQVSLGNSGKIAGITIGLAAAGAIYISLMFLLFKRYKKNKMAIELPPLDSELNLGVQLQLDGLLGFSLIFQRINQADGGAAQHAPGTLAGDMYAPGAAANNLGAMHISTPVNAQNSLGWAL